MTPQVFDVNGVQRDWAWLQGKYKCGMTAAPAGTAFRLVRVDETIGPAVFIVNVRGAEGAAQGGQPIAQWWPGAEGDERSKSLVGVGLQSVYHARAIVERTNSNGDIGFPYGAGGVIHDNGGPYEFWVLSPSFPSDAVTGLGWLGGTDHACPGRLTFQIVEGAPEPDPDPEPDPEPGDDAAWKRDVLEALVSISIRLDDLATHLGAV